MYQLDNQNKRYTWNNKWVQKYESAWGIWEKFRAANVPSNAQNSIIGASYPTQTSYFDRKLLIYKKGLPKLKTASPQNSLLAKLSNDWEIIEYNAFQHIIYPQLRFCKKCSEYGYHSVFHQLALLDHCLIHEYELNLLCKCTNTYALEWKNQQNKAFCCNYCKTRMPFPDIADGIIEKWEAPFPSPKIEISKKVSKIYILDANSILLKKRKELNPFQKKVLRNELLEGGAEEYAAKLIAKPERRSLSYTSLIHEIECNLSEKYGYDICKEQYHKISRRIYNYSYKEINPHITAAYILMMELSRYKNVDRLYPIHFGILSEAVDYANNTLKEISYQYLKI